MPSVGTASIDLEVDKHQLGRSIDSATAGVGSHVKSAFGSLGKIAGAALGGAVAFKAVGLVKDALGEAREAAEVGRQTHAVLKSTGAIANVSAAGVGKLADSLSLMSGIDDEVIQKGENLLLTFTNIQNRVGKGNDIFNQATKAMTDFAVRFTHGDMEAAATQLGKALNDPIQGVTALQRVGVSFTAKQKEQIKTLVDSGRTLDAQKVILKEIQTETAGAAAAGADAGKKFGVAWANVKEQLGTAILPLFEKLMAFLASKLPGAVSTARRVLGPFVEGLRAFFTTLRTGFTEDEGTPIERLALKIREFIPVLQSVIQTVGGWKNAFLIAGVAILTVISPITVVVGALALLYLKFQGVRDVVDAVVRFVVAQVGAFAAFIGSVLPQVQEAIGHFVAVVQAAWRLWGDDILNVARGIWQQIAGIIQIAVALVAGIIRVALALINGDWGKAWDALKDTVSGVWNGIKQVVGGSIDQIKGVVGAGFDVLKGIVTGFASGVSGVLGGIWNGLVTGFKAALNTIIRAWNHIEFKVPGWDPPGPGPKFGGFTLGVPDIPTLHTGGIVPGRPGDEVLALLEAGETVTPADQTGGPMVHTTIVMDNRVLAESTSRGMYDRSVARG